MVTTEGGFIWKHQSLRFKWGKKVGESRPGLFGGMNNYDANGHKTGEAVSRDCLVVLIIMIIKAIKLEAVNRDCLEA